MGAENHRMQYVDAPAETIPFSTGHFDAAFSFNSLDHVRDVDTAISKSNASLGRAGSFS